MINIDDIHMFIYTTDEFIFEDHVTIAFQIVCQHVDVILSNKL